MRSGEVEMCERISGALRRRLRTTEDDCDGVQLERSFEEHSRAAPAFEDFRALPLTAGALVVDIDSGRKGDIVGQGFKGGRLFSWTVKFSGDNSVQSWGPLDCAKSLRVIPENTVMFKVFAYDCPPEHYC